MGGKHEGAACARVGSGKPGAFPETFCNRNVRSPCEPVGDAASPCRRPVSERAESILLAARMIRFCWRSRASGTPLSALDPAGYPTVEEIYKRVADNITVRRSVRYRLAAMSHRAPPRQTVRKSVKQPLTLSEKIIYGHLDDPTTVRCKGELRSACCAFPDPWPSAFFSGARARQDVPEAAARSYCHARRHGADGHFAVYLVW